MNGVVFEVLADLAKKKEKAYSQREKGLELAQQIDAVEMHVKQMIKQPPIEKLITQGEAKQEGATDLSKVGV